MGFVKLIKNNWFLLNSLIPPNTINPNGSDLSGHERLL